MSTLAALVAAWVAYEEEPERPSIHDAMTAARERFATEHGLSAAYVRSEMLRLRQHRPQPDHAAVLVAIIEGTDS